MSRWLEQSKKTGVPEAVLEMSTRLMNMIRDVELAVGKIAKHYISRAGRFTTVAGNAVQEIPLAGVKSSHDCFVQMRQVGASPVSIVKAECQPGKIVVTFSADPGSDHQIAYSVI